MDVEINPDDVEICWKGFSDCLPTFVETTTNNLVAMRSAKAREIEPMFNAAKNWLMRDWKGAESEKTYRQALDLFPKMLFIPGHIHIYNNALEAATESLPGWREHARLLRGVNSGPVFETPDFILH